MNSSAELDSFNSSALAEVIPNEPPPPSHASPVVAFIIGLAIILLASILNAAGLNLTKLDHVGAHGRHWITDLTTETRTGPHQRNA